MPLENNPFGDTDTLLGSEQKTEVKRRILKTVHPVEAKKTGQAKPKAEQKKRTERKAKPSAAKQACTFHIAPELKEQLEALSFLTRESQTALISEAIELLVESRGVKLPKRVA